MKKILVSLCLMMVMLSAFALNFNYGVDLGVTGDFEWVNAKSKEAKDRYMESFGTIPVLLPWVSTDNFKVQGRFALETKTGSEAKWNFENKFKTDTSYDVLGSLFECFNYIGGSTKDGVFSIAVSRENEIHFNHLALKPGKDMKFEYTKSANHYSGMGLSLNVTTPDVQVSAFMDDVSFTLHSDYIPSYEERGLAIIPESLKFSVNGGLTALGNALSTGKLDSSLLKVTNGGALKTIDPNYQGVRVDVTPFENKEIKFGFSLLNALFTGYQAKDKAFEIYNKAMASLGSDQDIDDAIAEVIVAQIYAKTTTIGSANVGGGTVQDALALALVGTAPTGEETTYAGAILSDFCGKLHTYLDSNRGSVATDTSFATAINTFVSNYNYSGIYLPTEAQPVFASALTSNVITVEDVRNTLKEKLDENDVVIKKGMYALDILIPQIDFEAPFNIKDQKFTAGASIMTDVYFLNGNMKNIKNIVATIDESAAKTIEGDKLFDNVLFETFASTELNHFDLRAAYFLSKGIVAYHSPVLVSGNVMGLDFKATYNNNKWNCWAESSFPFDYKNDGGLYKIKEMPQDDHFIYVSYGNQLKVYLDAEIHGLVGALGSSKYMNALTLDKVNIGSSYTTDKFEGFVQLEFKNANPILTNVHVGGKLKIGNSWFE